MKFVAKIVNLSQQEPNADCDAGFRRRAIIAECRSRFIDETYPDCPDDWSGEDDYERRIFPVDYSVSKKIKTESYKLGLVKYLMEFSCEKITIPIAVKNETTAAMDALDNIRSSLEEIYVITGNPIHIIGKEKIHTMIRDEFNSDRSMNNKLKTYGITYNKAKRCPKTGMKGIYVGIRLRLDDE